MLTHSLSKTLLASLTAGIATFALTPAAHAEISKPRSVVVSYGDLDLNTATGKARLDRRIAYAAGTVCGPADMLSYESRMATAACESDAIANANRGLVQVFADASAGAGGGTLRVARK